MPWPPALLRAYIQSAKARGIAVVADEVRVPGPALTDHLTHHSPRQPATYTSCTRLRSTHMGTQHTHDTHTIPRRAHHLGWASRADADAADAAATKHMLHDQT